MIPVYLESPYAGDFELHTDYARRCVRDCLSRGEAPLGSHVLYALSGCLDESTDREIGIAAGLAWQPLAAAVVVYGDHGITPGMQRSINLAEARGMTVTYRFLLVREDGF